MWKDGEETLLVEGTHNVVYDQKGRVYRCCMKTGELRKTANGGFEKDRMCRKYLCPAEHYGIDCHAKRQLPRKQISSHQARRQPPHIHTGRARQSQISTPLRDAHFGGARQQPI